MGDIHRATTYSYKYAITPAFKNRGFFMRSGAIGTMDSLAFNQPKSILYDIIYFLVVRRVKKNHNLNGANVLIVNKCDDLFIYGSLCIYWNGKTELGQESLLR